MKPILLIILLTGIQSCKMTPAANNKTENKLIGSWKMVADQLLDNSYNVINQDTSVAGLIIYSPDGKMSAQLLWKGIRAPVMNDTIMKTGKMGKT